MGKSLDQNVHLSFFILKIGKSLDQNIHSSFFILKIGISLNQKVHFNFLHPKNWHIPKSLIKKLSKICTFRYFYLLIKIKLNENNKLKMSVLENAASKLFKTASSPRREQGCQIILVEQNVPKFHKIYQISKTFTNRFEID
jgi:hypothetical protein